MSKLCDALAVDGRALAHNTLRRADAAGAGSAGPVPAQDSEEAGA